VGGPHYWWSPIGSTRHCGLQWPIVPATGDYGDYDDGEIGGMIGRGNRSTRRKPAPVLLCPPQTPHAARKRTRAAAVGSQRLTAWATARPITKLGFRAALLFLLSSATPLLTLFRRYGVELCGVTIPFDIFSRGL
jgi:hypothetical protein